MTRFVFVTGGVVSSLGKGIAASSLGLLLKARGLAVSMQKFDPYLNIDPGTMSPFQHGEVFVTDDGAETDLDLGHYERFTGLTLGRSNNVTAGQIYQGILDKERRGDYLGHTVQVIPHVTDEIKARIVGLAEASKAEVAIVEIGGTVGDIESLPFLEAIRQMRLELGRERTCFIHLTLVPYIKAAHETKTKPTQHSVRELREIGIQPDILLCRSEEPLGKDVRAKIGLFTNVQADSVIEAPDVETIYRVPLVLHENGLDERVVQFLGIDAIEPVLDAWRRLVDRITAPTRRVKVAVVGKYTNLHDAYKSIMEAFVHAGAAHDARVDLTWIGSEELESRDPDSLLADMDGVLVPGGFGERGIQGKIRAAEWARTHDVPYFGICLGMQAAVVEFARNVCGWPDADSDEFAPQSGHKVIDLLPDQVGVEQKGGTMRLGSYRCNVAPGSRAHAAYGVDVVHERHRHRYEFNNRLGAALVSRGLALTGRCPNRDLVEIIEVPDHPWFLGVQFHPELKSRPEAPHPLFRAFVGAALDYRARHEAAPGGRAAPLRSTLEP
jgi:CTP synthase